MSTTIVSFTHRVYSNAAKDYITVHGRAEIDLVRLAQVFGPKIFQNKSGQAIGLNGAIKVQRTDNQGRKTKVAKSFRSGLDSAV